MDSLDDVKNHTYNELFVSGGFIVSDEFVLNPELITQGMLNLIFIKKKKKNRHLCVNRSLHSACAARTVQIVCKGY